MSPSEIERLRDQIIAEDGPWTSHWFEVAPGIETLPGKRSTWSTSRAMLALRSAQLALGKSANEIRALDLGCLEGGIAIALAKAGCETVGVEIREQSLRKARFAADALNVKNVQFVQGDMLRLVDLRLGTFDLIVCAGTLYHVDAPDLLPFLRSLNVFCKGIALFDTHVSQEPCEEYVATSGINVLGQSIVEHAPQKQNEKNSKLWASADNNHAFWPTERSLVNLLLSAGFVQVQKPLGPIPEWLWKDRAYWIAYSAAHAKHLGVVFDSSHLTLADPDLRAAQCPTILESIHKEHPNPNTKLRKNSH